LFFEVGFVSATFHVHCKMEFVVSPKFILFIVLY